MRCENWQVHCGHKATMSKQRRNFVKRAYRIGISYYNNQVNHFMWEDGYGGVNGHFDWVGM